MANPVLISSLCGWKILNFQPIILLIILLTHISMLSNKLFSYSLKNMFQIHTKVYAKPIFSLYLFFNSVFILFVLLLITPLLGLFLILFYSYFCHILLLCYLNIWAISHWFTHDFHWFSYRRQPHTGFTLTFHRYTVCYFFLETFLFLCYQCYVVKKSLPGLVYHSLVQLAFCSCDVSFTNASSTYTRFRIFHRFIDVTKFIESAWI